MTMAYMGMGMPGRIEILIWLKNWSPLIFMKTVKKNQSIFNTKFNFQKLRKKNQKLLIFSDLSIDFQQVFHSKF
jgi:hypothetical protein